MTTTVYARITPSYCKQQKRASDWSARKRGHQPEDVWQNEGVKKQRMKRKLLEKL